MASQSDSDHSYILLRYVGHPDNIGDFDDPKSIASQLARARGQGDPLILSSGGGMFRPATDENLPLEEGDQIVVGYGEGTVRTETGFVMRFVPGHLTSLSNNNLINLEKLKDYPVPETALDTLPAHIRNAGIERDNVRFTADYDRDEQRFHEATIGWEASDDRVIDIIQELIDETGHPVKALDYATYVHGPAEWQDIEAIAERRGVKPESVKENIAEIGEAISDDEDEE